MDGNTLREKRIIYPAALPAVREGRTCLPRGMQGCSTHRCRAAPWVVCSSQLCLQCWDLPHPRRVPSPELAPLLPFCASWTPPAPGACKQMSGSIPCVLTGALCTQISSKGGLGSGKQPWYQRVVVMLSPCPCSPPACDRHPGEGAGPAEAAGHLG